MGRTAFRAARLYPVSMKLLVGMAAGLGVPSWAQPQFAGAGGATDPRPGDTLLGKAGGVAYVSDPEFAAAASYLDALGRHVRILQASGGSRAGDSRSQVEPIRRSSSRALPPPTSGTCSVTTMA